MARITTVNSAFTAEVTPTLVEGGHLMVTPTEYTLEAIVATNPDLILCMYAVAEHNVLLHQLHSLGYPIMGARSDFLIEIGLINNISWHNDSGIRVVKPHEIFTNAGVPTDVNIAIPVGEPQIQWGHVGLLPDNLATFETAPAPETTTYSIIAVGDKGGVMGQGNTLVAPVMFNGLLYSFDDVIRSDNVNVRNIVNASIDYLTKGKISITGVTLDEFGEPAACEIRINKLDSGLPVGVITSDALTGAYSSSFTAGALYLSCFSNNPATEPLCVSIPDTSLDAVINFDFSNGQVTEPIIITSIIAGNVKKLGAPYGAKVVIMSDSLMPKVVGYGDSNPATGDYSIDVAPWTGEVMIAVIPEYGVEFVGNYAVPSADYVIHPTIPNGYVYVSQNSGSLSTIEPVWSTLTGVVSGDVTLTPVMLHRPLMNGFVKPTVAPI